MKNVKGVIILIALCLVANISYVSAANVQQSADKVDDDRFSFSNALTGMQYIDDWLKSFRALTKLTSDRISPEEKQQVGSLGWAIQNLGFYNHVKSVEGTLRKQEYEIRKLEYELAFERSASGKVSQAEVAKKEKRYLEAKSEILKFLANFHIAD